MSDKLVELKEKIASAPFSWVLVRTYVRREKSASRNIQSKIEDWKKSTNEDVLALAEGVYEIVVPEESIIVLEATGEKKRVARMRTPGYIILNLDISNDTLVREIRRTNDVVGFTGDYTPVALTVDEVFELLAPIVEKAPESGKKTIEVTASPVTAGTKASGVKTEIQYVVGEIVEVTDGPFKSMTGAVSEIELEHERIQVLISAFGRETPVDLHFTQIRKSKES
ncbi:hypothetical protein FACS1894125_6300 [Actinomycetota bacterium]|nr:hypothetical protein FACS1894125_6300 [Actinomycetota bacterium]